MSRLITVASGYGSNTKQPFVALTVQGQQEVSVQMSPAEARHLALNLIRGAEAAEGDEFLLRFATDSLGCSDVQAVSLLLTWRDFRSQRNGEGSEPIA